MESCIVVGAGIAGLLAAHTLERHGTKTVVLDQLPQVGGRMFTRRLNGGVFDIGAQFFTVRHTTFGRFVREWRYAGVAQEWCRGFVMADGSAHVDGHPRYRGTAGMISVVQHLQHGLDVRLGDQVLSAQADGAHWKVHTRRGEVYTAAALILTAPAPQALDVLNAGSVLLPTATRTAAEAIAYAPCISLMAVLDGPSGFPEPGGLQLMSEPLFWMADNYQKGISPDVQAITIHAGPEFSREFWDADDDAVARALLDSARPWLAAKAVTTDIRRWRYSRPIEQFPERFLSTTDPLPLAFAGDAYGEPRIEGAALSGLAAAEAICGLSG